jgi:hypothetical protein
LHALPIPFSAMSASVMSEQLDAARAAKLKLNRVVAR